LAEHLLQNRFELETWESIRHCTVRSPDVTPVVLGCFSSNSYWACAETAISELLVEILTSSLFSTTRHPKESTNFGYQTTLESKGVFTVQTKSLPYFSASGVFKSYSIRDIFSTKVQ